MLTDIDNTCLFRLILSTRNFGLPQSRDLLAYHTNVFHFCPDESMNGIEMNSMNMMLEIPVVPERHNANTLLQTKQVHYRTCGKRFTRQRTLRNHEETQHLNRNMPKALAQREKKNTYSKNRNRDRLISDPAYREKKRQICREDRLKNKSRVASCTAGHVGHGSNNVTATEMCMSVDLIEDPQQVEAEPGVDVDDASEKIKVVDVIEEDSDREDDVRRIVKKTRKKNATTGVFQVTTMTLTAENLRSFFKPRCRDTNDVIVL